MEVMNELLLEEIKLMYKNSKDALIKLHDLLCNVRLRVKEVELNVRFYEEKKTFIIMPKLSSFEEKIDYLIKNYNKLFNNENLEKEDLKFYLELLNEVIATLERTIKKLS